MSNKDAEIDELHKSYVKGKELLSTITQWQLRELLEYWLEKHPKNRLPKRADFDPIDIPKTLPYIVMMNVERNPFRLKFRLVGTVITNAFNRELTGLYFDESFDNYLEAEGYTQRKEVAEDGEPKYFFGKGKLKYDLDFTSIEWVLLPYAEDGENVDLIIAALSYGGE
ncbi:PAS domain-containing protein [Sneathiella sp. P13V-1]|uniref:PAS domain-containing protein n=1 Tax=Sneathiella sp. P13V-1 TaxID=2697366 RepID=UPI00187B6ACF|nr:PAS domain-containing protein [Sneathiella sp. P13V-1]MBE7636609.1 PAS domain-containing protein [Sneathiella sp. P13V-1]